MRLCASVGMATSCSPALVRDKRSKSLAGRRKRIAHCVLASGDRFGFCNTVLGYTRDEELPDHSSLTRIRHRPLPAPP
jgi:hypothetical protein